MDRQVLVEWIEKGAFLLPAVAGKVERLDDPHFVGRRTAIADPMCNMVGVARLPEHAASSIIASVRDRFASEGMPFSWLVGPTSAPSDLGAHLTAAGLTEVAVLEGLALSLDRAGDLPARDDVIVRPVTTDADLATAVSTLAACYPASRDVAELFCEAPLRHGRDLNPLAYLAYVSDTPDPVGISMMVDVPHQPICLLVSSATREGYRRRGVYTALTAHRVAEARRRGAEAVILQALSATSAPICRRLGFEPVCELSLYAWLG